MPAIFTDPAVAGMYPARIRIVVPLAGAVGTEERYNLTRLHREADLVDRDVVPIALREPPDFNHVTGVVRQIRSRICAPDLGVKPAARQQGPIGPQQPDVTPP